MKISQLIVKTFKNSFLNKSHKGHLRQIIILKFDPIDFLSFLNRLNSFFEM